VTKFWNPTGLIEVLVLWPPVAQVSANRAMNCRWDTVASGDRSGGRQPRGLR
jgi:hypothetical protein